MLWWVVACTGPEEPAGPTCPPAEGEILRLETGELGDDLDLMMRGTAGWVTLCLGPGTFPSNLEIDKTDEGLPGQVSWIGTEGTVIVPELEDTGAEPTPLRLLTNQPLVLQDLALEAPLELAGSTIRLADVGLSGLELSSEDLPAIALEASDGIELEDLSVNDVQADDVVLRLEAPTIDVDGLDYREVRSMLGSHIELHGEASLRKLRVEDTQVLRNEPGRALISAYEDATLEDAVFVGNIANGPALGAAQTLDAQGLEIREHRSGWTGALTLFGGGTLSEVVLHQNVTSDGALSLYPVAADNIVLIEQGDFGADELDNLPCDASIHGACVRSDLEVFESLLCDPSGCR